MTKQELLNLDHLSIAEETIFIHIHTEEGYILTPYFDGMDIREYYGSECYYMPIRDEYESFRVITEQEHKKYEEERDKLNELSYE